MLRTSIFAALLVAFTILPVLAEEDAPRPSRWDPAQMEQRRSDMLDKRRSLLHLTAAQEPAWQTYLSKTHFTPPTRPEHKAQLSEPERTQQMIGRLKEMEARLQTRLEALNELYTVLTPEQRTIFELTEHRPQGPWGGHRPGGGNREMPSDQE